MVKNYTICKLTYLIHFLVKVKLQGDPIKVAGLVPMHSNRWDSTALGVVSTGLMRKNWTICDTDRDLNIMASYGLLLLAT